MNREDNLRRLRAEEFDVLILGGGINGAGIARDLMLRAQAVGSALRVALVEQRGFASGTSSKNSQLIHGGLRYLKRLEFGLVREALRERATLLRIAPHLVWPQPFLIPMYGWRSRALYGTGVRIYSLLAGKQNLAPPRFLSNRDVASIEPALEQQGLTSGAIYMDARVDAARLVLENIFDAARHGAVVANYVHAQGKRLTDAFTGEVFEVHAKRIVDCTGPWETGPHLRLVRGSHIFLPRLNASDNAIAHFEKSGRIVFVIPWGELSLVGTTERDHENGPDHVRISRDEIDYLLGIVRDLYPRSGKLEPVSAYSSLRPLVRSGVASATGTSREHRIWFAPDGVLHVAGGKYTTYRAMSEEAVDLLFPEWKGACRTAAEPLPDTRAPHAYRLAEGDERSAIHHAVEHEMAQRLVDVLFVSTPWGYERKWTPELLQPLAERMGSLLKWNAARVEEEIRLVERLTEMPV
jgi:glycerol-3-phosphate dehydrogenase